MRTLRLSYYSPTWSIKACGECTKIDAFSFGDDSRHSWASVALALYVNAILLASFPSYRTCLWCSAKWISLSHHCKDGRSNHCRLETLLSSPEPHTGTWREAEEMLDIWQTILHYVRSSCIHAERMIAQAIWLVSYLNFHHSSLLALSVSVVRNRTTQRASQHRVLFQGLWV